MGCLATKQVRRTDEDPMLFDVVYHGTHTCVQNEGWGEATQTPPHGMRVKNTVVMDTARHRLAGRGDGSQSNVIPGTVTASSVFYTPHTLRSTDSYPKILDWAELEYPLLG